jgi:phosphate transport system substrate-binding protein
VQHRTSRNVHSRGNRSLLLAPRRERHDGSPRGTRLHSLSAFFVLLLIASVVAPLSGCTSGSKPTQRLNVSGSTTILPIAEQSAEAFKAPHPEIHVLVSGLGSSAGIEAVSAGTAQIGTSSRDLKDAEKSLGLVDYPIAYDGIAVIVSPENPVNNLTTAQLQDIFSGKVTNWSEVGGADRPIDLVNRDEASGTREAFQKIVMKDVKFDPHAAVLPGTGQVRDVVARAPGAIGYISLGFVKSRFSDVQVKAVAVNGVVPSEKTVASKEYPVGRVLHFFTKGEATGATKQFIDFVLSDAVQQGVVVDAGFIPVAEGGGK